LAIKANQSKETAQKLAASYNKNDIGIKKD
jgi:hypothetical protein